VASLALGFAWLQTGAQLLKLNVLGTMFTGVVALAVGAILWIGMPLLVIGVIALVALAAIVISSTVLSSGLPGQR
jgi:hypothetical protein